MISDKNAGSDDDKVVPFKVKNAHTAQGYDPGPVPYGPWKWPSWGFWGVVGALAAGGAAAVGAAAWLNGCVDAAGAAVVSRVGGRIPLVGGVFRTVPSTVYGAAQIGVLYVVNERVRA